VSADDRSTPRIDVDAEATLIARLRAGEESAFDAIYHEHAEPLWRFATRLTGSRADAEEIVHDVFSNIWEHRSSWTVHGGIAAYLFRAVRNRAIDVLRRAGVADRVSEDEDLIAAPPGFGEAPLAPDEQVELDELRSALQNAIAALPERRRTAVTLRYVQGLSYAQIAAVLGMSEKAAFILVSRTRDALRPIFERFTGE
jgi:RNA polymerase sigma-70 factor, ECF subfamily